MNPTATSYREYLNLRLTKVTYTKINEYEPDEYFKPEEERIVEGYSWIPKMEKPVALVYYKEIWGNYLPVLEMKVNE